jgi:pantothenate kinase
MIPRRGKLPENVRMDNSPQPNSTGPAAPEPTGSVDGTPATVVELAGRARLLASSGGRRILGITGAPGAGKSTVAAELAAALGPETAVLVPMDGFHLANSVLEALGRRGRKGAPDTFDDGGYAALLERLRRQTAQEPVIYAPDFRRELEEPIGSALPIRCDVPLVITEGNYLLLPDGRWPRARAAMDEVWFLATGDDIRRERLIRRHVDFGKSAADAETWALGSDETNAGTVRRYARLADLTVRLPENPGPSLH